MYRKLLLIQPSVPLELFYKILRHRENNCHQLIRERNQRCPNEELLDFCVRNEICSTLDDFGFGKRALVR